MTSINVPVLIVGGGGCGLSSSIFLSDLGIDHLLIERHAGTSQLPKAHYLNQRMMEIFRQHGIAESVYEQGAPMEQMGRIRWRTSLAGDGTLDGKTLYSMDAFGGGELAATYAKDSPCPPSNLPQLRLEPILRRHAEERAPGKVRFNQELTDLTQDADGVTATVLDRATGDTYTVRAQYLIAADGGKTIGPKLGATMSGPTGLLDIVSTHFTADLSQWWDDESCIAWFMNPDAGGNFASGGMVPMGPTWGRHSEEWVFSFAFMPDDPTRLSEDMILPKIRELLKVGDIDITVNKISHWLVEGVLVDTYRFDRVFLGGDAAHRHPPTTGLGLNTAIQDAHNLAWKLAAVIKGQATDALLDTYQSERQPVAERNVDWAMFTFQNHSVVDSGIGLIPDMPIEMRRMVYEMFFAETPMGAARRARFAEVVETQRSECQAHDLEIGFAYPTGAVVPDGSAPPPLDPMGSTYYPTTRPGHRLPHAWIERDADRISTHDLTGRTGEFVLITDPGGNDWTAAAATAAEKFDIAITTVSIGEGGHYTDPDNAWAQVREISEGGAILVRPDNHVAWRTIGAQDQPDDTLAAVLGEDLSR